MNPKIKIFFAIVFLIIFVFICFVLIPKKNYLESGRVGPVICFDKNCFKVEIADTKSAQEKGLMFRSEMDLASGMLFVFNSENIYPFWMKNTLIPLDIIWMDKNYNVVFVGKNEQPCRKEDCPIIDPKISAKYVLEINSGISSKIGIDRGAIATFIP